MKFNFIFATIIFVLISRPNMTLAQDVFDCKFNQTASASLKGYTWERENWKSQENFSVRFVFGSGGHAEMHGNNGVAPIASDRNNEGINIVEKTQSGNYISTLIMKKRTEDGLYMVSMLRNIALSGSSARVSINIGWCKCTQGSMEHALSGLRGSESRP